MTIDEEFKTVFGNKLNINNLENGLLDWKVNAASGDSLTLYWGLLGEYYFKFYAQ